MSRNWQGWVLETQIIVNNKSLGCIFGGNRHPQLLGSKFKEGKFKWAWITSECEVQVSDSSEQVANKPSSVESNCNKDLPTQGDLF